MLLQNRGKAQRNRQGVGTLIGDAGWAIRTARCGRPPERVLTDLAGAGGDAGQDANRPVTFPRWGAAVASHVGWPMIAL